MSDATKPKTAAEFADYHLTYRGTDPLGFNKERPKLVRLIQAAMDQARAEGFAEAREMAAGKLAEMWEEEHDKDPDERMGDGSPEVITACLDAIDKLTPPKPEKPQ